MARCRGARKADSRVVVVAVLLALAGTVAFAAPLFQEGPLVATSDAVEVYSLALDELGELPVARASAIAVAADGTTWVLQGRRLRSFAADGAWLSDTRLPTDEDEDEDEDDDDDSEHVALAVLSDGVAVALERDLFLVNAAGDVTSERTLPYDAVAAGVHGARLWVAHENGVVGFEGGVPVANVSLNKKKVKDLSVAADGALWIALGKEIRVVSPSGALLRSRTIDADLVSTTRDGAWIAAGPKLTRLDTSLQSIAVAPAFPNPSKIVSLAADSRDDSVFAAAKKRIRHVGAAGEVLADASVEGSAKVNSQHAVALRVDRAAPSIVFLSPLSGSCTSASRVPLVVAFHDAGVGPNPVSLSFATSLGPLPVTCAFLGGQASCTPVSDLPQGVITVSATIADLAGVPNVSAPAVVTFEVDSIAPSIALSSVPPTLTNVALLSLAGTLSEFAVLTINGTPLPVSDALTWSFTASLVEGVNAFELVASDCHLEGRLAFAVRLDTIAPPAPDGGAIFVSESVGGLVDVRGDPGAVEPGATVTVTNLRTGVSMSVVSADGTFLVTLAAEPGDPISISVRDAAGNTGASTSTSVPEKPGDQLPPDPVLIAPKLDPSVAYDTFEATRFLWESVPPIQSGVVEGAIDPRFVAILRGVVLTRDGAPLPGVTITAVGAPELGSTRSRADGAFDFVVNGSGTDSAILTFEITGFEPAQRRVKVPWRTFVEVDEIRLVPRDSVVTVADLSGAGDVHIHRATPSNDDRGYRQLTLIIPSGTTAERVMPDGSRENMPTATLTVTEYGVGPNGQAAMPGRLPPSSAYTLCFSITADEEGGAITTELSRPAAVYLEDFYGLGPGMVIPVGTYSFESGQWIAEENGLTLEIAGIANGRADLIIDGSGLPASDTRLEALGITMEEREALATIYPTPGTGLWRVSRNHFSSPADPNVAASQNDPAPTPTPTPLEPMPKDWSECGQSVVQCGNQALGESFGIQGTPYSIVYSSDRVPGRRTERSIRIPITGPTLPPDITSVRLDVSVAGQRHSFSYTPSTNLSTTFVWDGNDGYGRAVTGSILARVRVTYFYPIRVSVAGGGGGLSSPQFGLPGNGVTLLQVGGSAFAARSLETYVRLSAADARGVGLGGWTLSSHHQYHPDAGKLVTGRGARQSGDDRRVTVDRTLGRGAGLTILDGMQGRVAVLNTPRDVEVGPDGSVYVSDSSDNTIWKQLPDGSLVRFAGLGRNAAEGFSGDGGPARAASLARPHGLGIGPDGSVYIADYHNHRIRRVDPSGTITTVAGNGIDGFSGDFGPATAAKLYYPTDVAVGPDGSLFIGDFSYRIRRVGTDGIITTYAGNGLFGNVFNPSAEELGDGGLATRARLAAPLGVAVASDGSVFVADYGHSRIRKITPDGRIASVAGSFSGTRCEGCLATESKIMAPGAVALAPDGGFTFTEAYNGSFDGNPAARIRRVFPDGRIVTLNATPFSSCLELPEQVAIPAVCSGFWGGMAFGPDGRLYFVSPQYGVVYRAGGTNPLFSLGESRIPSESGSEIYVFDLHGRHLRTVDALTGSTRVAFAYDSEGRLASLTDGHGNVTAIERSGDLIEIVAPGGQRTTLRLGADSDWLESIANDAGEEIGLATRADGLIVGITRPRGFASVYDYDGDGRLTRTGNAAGGFQTYARSGGLDDFLVTRTTAEGRATTYGVSKPSRFETETRATTFPDGTRATEHKGTSEQRTITRPDGMSYFSMPAPDPRFGASAPITGSSTARTPAGLLLETTRTRTQTLVGGFPSTQTDTSVVNGKTWTSSYSSGPPRRTTTTSPEGRTATTDVDAHGRVIRSQAATLAAVDVVYRADGLLESTVQGAFPDSRAVSMTYNSRRELASVTDPLGRTTSFQRDLAGRVTRQVLPDGREILTSYDANGNVTSVTPPSRPAHQFTYTEIDLEKSYNPPDVAGATPGVTSYAYDLDRRLTLATRPDGATVALSYAAPGGKLSEIAHAAAAVTYSYDPTTGQLAAMSESGGSSLSYEYDGSLVLSETMFGGVGGQVSRAYDSDFRVREERVNGVEPIAVVYDNDSLPEQVGGLLLSRNPATGMLDGTTLGSVATALTTNAFGEPVAETAHVGSLEVLGFAYNRDVLGRITGLRERIGGIETSRDFTYDGAGRLTDVSVGGVAAAHWTYDGNSNRVSATTSLGTVTADYDEQDRLLRHGDATFTYTANGELATRTDLSGTTSYGYDAVGNLRRTVLADGRVIDYLIDARNRRVGKKVDGVLVQAWLYRDQLEPVAELDGAGNVVSRFVYVTKGHSPDYMIRDGRTYRILSDHLGSPRLVINVDTGAIVQRMDFDEWGVVTLDTNPGWQPFGFAGGLLDADTGLTRFGARDYAAAEGRWTAKDAAGLGAAAGMMFVYSHNDPVNLIDMTGFGAQQAQQAGEAAPRFVPFIVPFIPPPPPALLPFLGPAGLVGGAMLCGAGIICDPQDDLSIPEGGAEPSSCPAPQATPAPNPKHKCPDPVAEAECKANCTMYQNLGLYSPPATSGGFERCNKTCEDLFKNCTKTPINL